MSGAPRDDAKDPLPVALGQLIRRNRRRYGGYIVHAGLAVLLSGWPPRHPSSTPTT